MYVNTTKRGFMVNRGEKKKTKKTLLCLRTLRSKKLKNLVCFFSNVNFILGWQGLFMTFLNNWIWVSDSKRPKK